MGRCPLTAVSETIHKAHNVCRVRRRARSQKAASASRTSSICRQRMRTAARLVRSLAIVTRTRRMARPCAVIGRRHVRPVRSNLNVQRDQSGGLRDGSTNMFSEAVQQRLDKSPQAMRLRRETAEHPFGTLKMRMGATHFLMKRLPKVATEMALHVLAYNLTRVMNIMGPQPLMAAIRT